MTTPKTRLDAFRDVAGTDCPDDWVVHVRVDRARDLLALVEVAVAWRGDRLFYGKSLFPLEDLLETEAAKWTEPVE